MNTPLYHRGGRLQAGTRVCDIKGTNTAKFRPIARILASPQAEMAVRRRSCRRFSLSAKRSFPAAETVGAPGAVCLSLHFHAGHSGYTACLTTIHLITTGGTIEKIYSEQTGQVENLTA